MAEPGDLRDRLRRVVAARMVLDTAHDLAHLDRVWANACAIAGGEAGVNRTVLLAAVYLHDLVNLPKDHPQRARGSVLAAEAAVPILRDLGLGGDCDAVCHAIAAHSFSAGIVPETIEARVLRDADRLDALGAVGIARCFAVSGALGRALYDPGDPWAGARGWDDGRYAMDHWPVKLLRLPEGMLTATGRRLAQERVAVMRRYAEALAAEIGVALPGAWGA